MRKFWILTAVYCLGCSMGLNTASLDKVTAQSSSILLRSVNQSPSSNNARVNADANANELSFSLPPISQTCPFPSIPTSAVVSSTLLGLSGEATVQPQTLVVTSEATGTAFVPGDGSDSDLGMTITSLVEAGKLDEALKVAQQIKDVSLKNEELSRIATVHREAGQLEQALQIAKSIAEPSQSNSNFRNDEISIKDNVLSEIAQAYMKVGQLGKPFSLQKIWAILEL
ncbi:tetratricopeptide repeat protein [Gloeocapsopsis dulcis]|uniref:Tetratricopeptide repeat protein n=1 Tax=Gloeocapsopsis dulcis AAB1 = 1H9 TaxID=1433147 RepID=A0A6N8FZA0_9CHRO|nr:tetratricopeptide repeat protein [Gloeocapsopsis dulcis]MUL38281.1 hypothetical protein [Gloeocapsopsis dulcis AAB1 = 1H9]WNN89329.1 hypothetical protein P0S91_24365 [Gloeocapsopsis dulcis]